MIIQTEDYLHIYHLLSQPDKEENTEEMKREEIHGETSEKNEVITTGTEAFKLPCKSWSNPENIILVGIILEYYIIHGQQCKWSLIHELYTKALDKYEKISQNKVRVFSLHTRTLMSLKKHYHYLRQNLKESQHKKTYWNRLYQLWKSNKYNGSLELCNFKTNL